MAQVPKVFVSRRLIGLDDYAQRLNLDVWENGLPPSPGELRQRTRGCAGLVSLLTDRIDADFLDTVPGLKVISQYATLGLYDFVTVIEAADNETAAHLSIDLGSRGTVNIQTLPALSPAHLSKAMKGPKQIGKD